jgi:hypothetical protein
VLLEGLQVRSEILVEHRLLIVEDDLHLLEVLLELQLLVEEPHDHSDATLLQLLVRDDHE